MAWKLGLVGASAIPEQAQEGGGGIWRRLHDGSQAVRKKLTRGPRVKAEGGHPAQKEGVTDVEVQRAHGLRSNPDSGLVPGLSLAWPSGGHWLREMEPISPASRCLVPSPLLLVYKMCSQREAMGLGPWG